MVASARQRRIFARNARIRLANASLPFSTGRLCKTRFHGWPHLPPFTSIRRPSSAHARKHTIASRNCVGAVRQSTHSNESPFARLERSLLDPGSISARISLTVETLVSFYVACTVAWNSFRRQSKVLSSSLMLEASTTTLHIELIKCEEIIPRTERSILIVKRGWYQ